jgi:3,4-dihydroxy 2-butanone 4-phosphate synthase/GTP cyclohydrolase II
MSRTPQLLKFAATHGLKCITIADLVRYRLKYDRLVESTAVAQLPTRCAAMGALCPERSAAAILIKVGECWAAGLQ